MLKRLIKKMFNNGSSKNHLPANIVIGKNTQINGVIDVSRAKHSKVIIGDDCLICGTISLETDEAVVTIGNNVFVGHRTLIICSNKITIESDILISADCMIQDSDNHSVDYEIRKKDLSDWKRNYHDWSTHPCVPIKISFGSWIGGRAIILKGVTVGEKAIVGAGSVVTKDVDPLTVVAGNPARIIKRLS
jgi:acetyltransferase-like isoleucine patch superfamily enzyme